MSRLSEIFRTRKKCFIPFVTAGHPDLETSTEIVLKLAEAGADVVEIGIPFSDPIADGPVIQKSSFEALRHGYSMGDYIEMVRWVRSRSEVGMIFMSYLNPLLSYGLSQLEKESSGAGLDGILISDLTPEEYQRMEPFAHLDTVFLAAPTSSEERLEKICRVSRGFLYLVARTGVTGDHSDVEAMVPKTLERIRRHTDLPVAVGFGIASAADVDKVWRFAEGAVVGSAIVRFIEDRRHEARLPDQVKTYVQQELLPKDRP